MLKKSIFILFFYLFIEGGCKPKVIKEKDPNTLNICALSDPFSFDPRIAGDRNSQVILRMLYDGLMRIGVDGKPEKALTKDLSISEDGKRYTFFLKKTYWSNGETVTAYDFERSWKKAISLDFSSHYAYAFYIIKNVRDYCYKKASIEEVGIYAKADDVLVVDLEYPAPYFLELVSNPVYSPVHRFFDQKGSNWFSINDMVCNGPFKMQNWKFKQEIILDRNGLYWDEQNVYLEQINISIISDNCTALMMFERGEIDWIGEPLCPLPQDAISSLKNEKNLLIGPPLSIYWCICNTKKPPFNNLKIRKALAYAVDRNSIVKHYLEGNELPALSILPPQLSLRKTPYFKDHDLQKALTLFNQALEEMNFKKEELPSITITHSSGTKIIPQILQEQWKKAFNIPIEVQGLDWHSCLKKVMTKDFQIMGLYWESWINDPIYNLRYNELLCNEIDPKIDQLLTLSDQTINIDERNNFLLQVENLLLDQMQVIPIYFRTDFSLKKSYVKDLYFTPLGNPDFRKIKIELPLTQSD